MGVLREIGRRFTNRELEGMGLRIRDDHAFGEPMMNKERREFTKEGVEGMVAIEYRANGDVVCIQVRGDYEVYVSFFKQGRDAYIKGSDNKPEQVFDLAEIEAIAFWELEQGDSEGVAVILAHRAQ